jgi:hypothetical protein
MFSMTILGPPAANGTKFSTCSRCSLENPALHKRYREMGRAEFAADQRTPATHKVRLDAEIERLRKLLHDAGITPDQ